MRQNQYPDIRIFIVIALFGLAAPAVSSQGDAELAQELTNPVADIVTVPIQMNVDLNIGPGDDGTKVFANVQPVIPFELNADWNLITRTIMPIVYQDDIFSGAGSQFGLGDTSLSLFFSPKKPTKGGIIWGAGPILLLPAATDSMLGAKKWGAGPAVIALEMSGPWTTGILANHVWSFAGKKESIDISNSFMQPFVAYTWPSVWTVSLQSETTCNWKTEQWSVPINVAAVKFGKLPVSLQAGQQSVAVGGVTEPPAASS